MYRITSRPLVAGIVILIAVSAGRAQEAAPAESLCDSPGILCSTLTNADLSGVFGWEAEELDAEGGTINSGTTGRRLASANLAVANVLSQLDIDGDGTSDRSADTDGDGLPDNWEIGGVEALTADGVSLDRVVFYPAPSAIVPGTPPTPIFTRLAVATSALEPDTDGDGLSDFVEVFGLKFIDENGNGLLESSEWEDKNRDGLPSPGEYPIEASLGPTGLLHDFDGFIFTDPTNPDSDGDGISDGADLDPLINLRAFGNTGTILVRFDSENPDIDRDGLGNAMDMGNDLVADDSGIGGAVIPQDIQAIDNPASVGDLIDLFRADLALAGVVPEAAVEDLIGVDWDGNGLWRITDVRTWHIVIDDTDPPPTNDFTVSGRSLFATQSLDELLTLYNDTPSYDRYGGRGVGMGWQDVLRPSGTSQFIPDRRVWAILYSWRMPGFDIDGDGFMGVPNLASTAPSPEDARLASVALRGDVLSDQVRLDSTASGDEPFDDRIPVGEAEAGGGGLPELDGRIDAPAFFPAIPFFCGSIGMISLLGMPLGLGVLSFVGRGARR